MHTVPRRQWHGISWTTGIFKQDQFLIPVLLIYSEDHDSCAFTYGWSQKTLVKISGPCISEQRKILENRLQCSRVSLKGKGMYRQEETP
jgi:hypothetical protein